MKQKQRDRLIHIGAAALLLGAVGVILWQGVQYLDMEKETQPPRRLQGVSSSVSAVESASSMTVTQTTWHETSTAAMQTDSVAVTTMQTVSFPLNLNAASAAELEQLPGVGEALAERITAYRTQLGQFSNREQLLEVRGIGADTLGQVYDLLFVENETWLASEPQETAAAQEAETAEKTPQMVQDTEAIPVETVPTEPPVLDLNTATETELLLLPDMTPELAAEIVAFRTENQCFSSVYELLYLDGMTETYFVRIRDYVQTECADAE